MKVSVILFLMTLFLALVAVPLLAQTQKGISDLNWKKVATGMPEKWYGSDEAKAVVENVLFCQYDIGGWAKNKPYHHPLSEEDKAAIKKQKAGIGATIDNGATTTELNFLARVYKQTKDDRIRASFLKGVDYLFKAQYPNGGWPQFYPFRKGRTVAYASHITFNDNAMVNVMILLKDLANGENLYTSLNIDEKTKNKAKSSFEKGLECILKTQIIVNGKPTVWCAQHDEFTLLPANARAYELASFSGSESVGLTQLLMDIENPSGEIITAVKGAVKWFEEHRIEGIKLVPFNNGEGMEDLRMAEDKTAPILWARFYDLETGKPFFCDRDGIKRNTFAELGHDRRNGYSWYTEAPAKVLKRYPEWVKKWRIEPWAQGALKVSANGRFLEHENGIPFFWLGDISWLLFQRLNREEAKHYFADRSAKGFNVVQCIFYQSYNDVSAYGDSAFVNKELTRPLHTPGKDPNDPEQYDYWDHVEYVVDLAAQYGIYMAISPTWGQLVLRDKSMTTQKAAAFASHLARFLKNKPNIIWINGGSAKPEVNTDIWEAIGSTIKETDPGHLITFHPFGRMQSSTLFHHSLWLDVNMFTSGHRRYDQDDTPRKFGEDNWRYVREDLAKTPAKPTIDGEPSFESLPQGLHDQTQPYWKSSDIRRYAYWSVFAGACGHTYGQNSVRQVYKQGVNKPESGAKLSFNEALNDSGSFQMVHLKKLVLSRPFFERVGDQSVVAGDEGELYDRILVCKGKSYLMAYTYTGRDFTLQMGNISGKKVKAWWYNPRSGEATYTGKYKNRGQVVFNPPFDKANGNDWVLVLDDASESFEKPGSYP